MDLTRLREYQLEDAKFLAAHEHAAACFGEQRTGKTPTALAACALRGYTKLLVICPASAVYPWTDEYFQWTGQSCLACVGTKTKRIQLIKEWTHGLIISYDSLKETQRTEGVINQILAAKPEAVILDEAHRIKNRTSAQAKAAFRCAKIPYRLALSGTPAPNRSYEIWSILHFLYPNYFKSYWNYINENYVTNLLSNKTGQKYIDILYLKPGRREVIQELLSQVATMRKRKEIMQWLPDKDYQQVRLPLTKEQLHYLQELDTMWETEHIITQGILDRLVRYRQVCLAPQLLGLKGTSPKITWILQYLQDYPDKSIVIFSKFTSFLKLLAEQIKEKGVLFGETPIKKRKEYCDAFQTGQLKILLINIDVGKESLTLDRAECMIFTDKYPPVGDILQAEDRFIATTKERANKAHTIIELMMKDSYDETLYELIKRRQSETDIINNYKKYIERKQCNGNRT